MKLPHFPKRLLAVLVALAGSSDAARVGLLDFSGPVERASLAFLAQTLPNSLAEPLATESDIQIVERAQLNRLVQEKGLALSGLTEGWSDSARALVPADDLVLGQFSGTLEALVVQVRVVESGTGALKGAFTRTGPLQEILAGMPTLASQIALAVRGDSSGRLTFSTQPAGATVYLDGLVLGRTPMLNQRIPPGKHLLSAELDLYRAWRDTIVVEPSTVNARKVDLVEDDDRSGLWFGGGAVASGMTRDNGDPVGPSYSGYLTAIARGRRFGLEFAYFLPTSKDYSVSFPVPWGRRASTRTLRADQARLLIVGDALQRGPWSVHLGGGLGISTVGIDPADLGGNHARKTLLGGTAAVGVRLRPLRWIELVAEGSAFSSFDKLSVIDITERDLFQTHSETRQFRLQSWTAQLAARFRFP